MPYSRRGSHREISGTNTSSANSSRIAITKGMDSFVYSSIEQSRMLQQAAIAVPTGGVMQPRVQTVAMITPKWMGLTPSCCSSGRKIGVKMMMLTAESITMPIKMRNNRIRNIKTYLLSERLISASPILVGIPL